MENMLERDALFSDETAQFRIPAEPECDTECTIRFRTAAGYAESVYIDGTGGNQNAALGPHWNV